jgi:hypothetical protein
MEYRGTASSSNSADARRVALIAWNFRDRHRALWSLPLTLGLAFVIGLLLLRGTAEDPQKNLVESRAAVLALAPPSVPDAENAALDYAAAHKMKVKYQSPDAKNKRTQWPDDHPDYFLSKASTYFEQPAVQQFYNDNEPAVTMLHAGAAKERCDWKNDYGAGLAMGLAHLAQHRNSARLLAGHARVRAHAGDHQAAAKDIAAIYVMARHVETDPIVISGLVAVAICAIADATVEAIMTWDTPTNAMDVAAYRRAVWQDRKPGERVARALRAEKASVLNTLDGLFTGAAAPGIVGGAMGVPKNAFSGVGGALFYGPERRCIAGVMDDMISRADRPPAPGEDEDEGMALVDRHQTGTGIFARLLAPVTARISLSFYRSEEQARVMDAGLAVLQFRLQHRRDPKTLDELVPEFLPSVPRCVFSDDPLRLRVDPEGVVERDVQTRKHMRRDRAVLRVYGVGPNGKDDGGRNFDGTFYGPEQTGDDAVFCVPPVVRTPPEPLEPAKKGAR